ncbi:TonB-dependent receptor [Myroides ceti]|uniref:TonB-dependent receptor n=1 Tax=Paenimyroides ceti TaxID=395087 RepID=A0ABT8CR29_9FLAO|nr:TonB-dependent receptor [Paenimyroides ceti]MDN3706441.1 TonB-dependent receptor [Paenimyroides ceti]
MNKKWSVSLLFSILACHTYAQENNQHTELEELIITDDKLRTHNLSQTIRKINDTVVKTSNGSLTDLLLFNSSIYFKENGFGMVSSPSFRGTTAQQTSVVWNGLRINSLLLGQTDFNSISYKEYNDISIKPGGGSVLYGSGAIGGTIHLNNELKFSNHFDNELQLTYGSYNTYRVNYNLSAGNDKWSTQININRNESDNDFDIEKQKRKNLNGQYWNNSINTSIGYRINRTHDIRFFSHIYDDERHFSLISVNQIKTKYQNQSARNLLQWKATTQKTNSIVRLAYINENYRYFDYLPSDRHSGGEVNSYIIKYDLDYKLTEKIVVSLLMDYQHNKGKGNGSGFAQAQQEILSSGLLLKHTLSTKSGYELGIKKEFTKAYENPLLYSAGFYISPIENYTIKLNGSKNYRIPTFNDIYWEPGGNKNLKPESSYQADLSQEINWKNWQFSANVYAIFINDMIRWLPTNEGYWQASNTNKVTVKGVELFSAYRLHFGSHHINVQGTYAYTDSRDNETEKQLIYVPFHKITGSIQYRYKNLSLQLQGLMNGKVYTTTSNDENSAIDPYTLFNTQVSYRFGKKNEQMFAFEIKNASDKMYENTLNRPMPGRNYTIQYILKF